MKKTIKFILYILIVLILCYIKNLNILIILMLLNMIMCLYKKVNIKKIELISILLLLFLTMLINSYYEGKKYAFLLTLRLINIYQITKIYSKSVNAIEIAKIVETLLTPLKIFKINTENIGIIIAIAITVMPILLSEINQKISNMNSKGMRFEIKSISIFFKSILISILIRCNEMEKSLIASGWNK